MKKLVCSLMLMLCLVSLPISAIAAEEKEEPKSLGFWFEGQMISNGTSKVTGYYEHSLTESFGFYVLAETESTGYREAYAGPTFKPFSWLQVGIGVGIEHMPDTEDAPNSARYNAFFNIDWKNVAAYGTLEGGGSGLWHHVRATYKLFDERIAIGVMDETDLGIGPRLEYNFSIKAVHMQIWGAVLYNYNAGETMSTAAINFSF